MHYENKILHTSLKINDQPLRNDNILETGRLISDIVFLYQEFWRICENVTTIYELLYATR